MYGNCWSMQYLKSIAYSIDYCGNKCCIRPTFIYKLKIRQHEVTWEPYFLMPDLPPEGVEKSSEYAPDTPRFRQVIQDGKDVGIDLAFKLNIFPNTLFAHCALEYASHQDSSGKIQNDLQEVLFKSYFTNGEYPDLERVTSLAESVGLNGDDVKAYVTDQANQQQVKAKQWSGKGITETPSFFINGKKAFSGVQEPNKILPLFDEIAAK